MKLHLLSITLLCVVIGCYARPDGAPSSACSSLKPAHSGIESQDSDPPYVISAVRTGKKVEVKISSPVGEEFEGFILQARSEKDPSKFIDGEFTSSEESKATDCFGGKKNTLTQVQPSPKKEIVSVWTPSGAVHEAIIFRATVAKTFAIFWTEIDSTPVKMKDEEDNNMEGNSPVERVYENCSTNKNCFGLPLGCVQQANCEVLLTYVKVPDGTRFGLHGVLDSQRYIAMALSDDAVMGEDKVTECIRDGSNVVVRESWNEGKSNTRTKELSKDLYESSFSNGVTSCFWTTPFVTISNGKTYDLANKDYYVLLAKGKVSSGTLNYHDARLSTSEAVQFSNLGHTEDFDSIGKHGDETTVPVYTDHEPKSTSQHEAKSTSSSRQEPHEHSTTDTLHSSFLFIFTVISTVFLGLIFTSEGNRVGAIAF